MLANFVAKLLLLVDILFVQAIDVWMGLCTAFVFSALVEFTIVNFWFRKQRYQQQHISNIQNVEKSSSINPQIPKATTSKLTKSAYQINTQNERKLFENHYLCNYHQRQQKYFSSLNNKEKGMFRKIFYSTADKLFAYF